MTQSGPLFWRLPIMASSAAPKNIDEYIASFPPEVRTILEKIRSIIQKVAPKAEETISYQMPAFKEKWILIYFAAFKKHIGIFPPVKGDEKLLTDLIPYRGEKGNLKFPLAGPIPYSLIRRVAKSRLKELREKGKKN